MVDKDMQVTATCPKCGCMFGTNDAKLEFNRIYINAKELSEISGMTYNECLKVIEQCRYKMKEKNYYIPESKTKMALFRIVCEFLGLLDKNIKKDEEQ